MTETAAPTPDRRSLALVAIFLGGIAIGGSPIFVRLSEVGPIATAFWRLAIAFVPLFAFALFQERGWAPLIPKSRQEFGVLVMPGLFLAADLVCWHLSIVWTSIANATLLINLTPVVVTAFAWAFLGQAVTRRFLIGLVLALAGVAVLKGGGVGGGHWTGDVVAVIGAAFYAGYLIALGQARITYGTMKVMVWNTFSAAVFILPMALVTEPVLFPTTLPGWAAVTGLAMISHVAGQALIVFALAWLPTAFSSLTLLLQPVVAALLGIVIIGEMIGIGEVLGGALVLAGIVVAKEPKA